MECSDPQLSIDFLYELIRCRYVQEVDVRKHKELIDICESPEVGLSGLELPELSPKELASLSPDALLLRWLNYHHLAAATQSLTEQEGVVKTFGGENVRDCRALLGVLSRVKEVVDTDGEWGRGREGERRDICIHTAHTHTHTHTHTHAYTHTRLPKKKKKK